MTIIEVIEGLGIFLGFIGLGLAIADKFKQIEQSIMLLKTRQNKLCDHINIHCKALCRMDTELEHLSPDKYDRIGDLKPECKLD